ncbi:MAG: hypothetical protein HC904_09335 [Blastochloris sp.]|nr:hypothetical protein [Blastochloris sp.]
MNDRSKTPTGGDQAMEYEFKYFDHGAVTETQKANRKGHYYVINWADDAQRNP